MASKDLINKVNQAIVRDLMKINEMLSQLHNFHDNAQAVAKNIETTFEFFLKDIGQFAPKPWTGDAPILEKIDTLLKFYEIK
jgi:hypothetical protein